MTNLMFILKFFGGLILMVALGGILGQLLNLDRYKFLQENRNNIDEEQQSNSE